MKAFAALLDRLSFEPRRLVKEKLVLEYLAATPDPDRGYALAALAGALTFRHAKPAILRGLISERSDPRLFELSYDFVGDLSETIALMWPIDDAGSDLNGSSDALALSDVVHQLQAAGKTDLPGLLTYWLSRLDETGRWALLKLVTGGLRIGVSARSAKVAVARLGEVDPSEVEEVWHGLEPPYQPLFDWVEGRGPKPSYSDPAPFRPAMLAHPFNFEKDGPALNVAEHQIEWKWDGIRVQAAAGRDEEGRHVARLYTRTGDDISAAFPDLLEHLAFDGALDGELLVMRDGKVAAFSDLQKRLNRKTVGAKLLREFPAALRAYDLLAEGGEDLRPLPLSERRPRLERFVGEIGSPRIDLSAVLPLTTLEELAVARSDPAAYLKGPDAEAVEGLMIKRRDTAYLTGRPKGPWYKWKREPHLIDAVLMYAQRGHGKRSSFYSDYTFGVWTQTGVGADDPSLVPVGKAYFGFTDEELKQIDRFVRANTVNRFGPVREVTQKPDGGLVLEVAFEGLNRSPRHKSGLAMRFPRISRLRWDKPASEADTLETLEALLPSGSS
ncbi:cisplatin damage response ATP-dependent DNA ligase [Roseibium sp. CAU 1637]|uniref:DNA ligase (ATP) n=1 Tax=Roseibium limicola TaxID=2816037 RepID=A0A939EN11_9HYPH|nr:cisplatin damage response ATP-dependent DNA ligase [Roseibium limicola]MBO0345418.1 cisplatin damage response ATP-dependent DNA ligase [Roseibium limicola]